MTYTPEQYRRWCKTPKGRLVNARKKALKRLRAIEAKPEPDPGRQEWRLAKVTATIHRLEEQLLDLGWRLPGPRTTRVIAAKPPKRQPVTVETGLCGTTAAERRRIQGRIRAMGRLKLRAMLEERVA